MASGWNIDDLIQLVRQRYPDWDGFDHPRFVADEIRYKQATVDKARQLLSLSQLDQLIAADDYESMLDRLERLSRDNNLLWRNVPSAGDTALLYDDSLDEPAFALQLRNLLYGDRPSPERLQTFADYAAAQGLPNRWPFPTYFLFICHPQQEMFVKPRSASWFLKFMGEELSVTGSPDASIYALIRNHVQSLYEALAAYGVRDWVDIQSLIWICSQESRDRTGRLSPKGQVELDVPPTTTYEISSTAAPIKEDASADLTKDGLVGIDPQRLAPVYTLEQCAADTGLPEETLRRWLQAIARKKQAIFYGPPGTSKTFVAERLARHLASGGDGRHLGDGQAELVQFHPAYAYEDFVQGIRPTTGPDGELRYELVPGRFLRFCDLAGASQGISVLVIDEINRANTATVFGELMYLMEYRDQEIPLAGGGRFSIPENVRLIGTMNTADRSIALVDHALRRRFAFIRFRPNFDILRRYHAQYGVEIEELIITLTRLNNQIGDPDYHIGHSFFLRPDLSEQIADIWQMEIEPYLEEYFFDQPDQIEAFRWQQVKPAMP